nr:hypothetical protein [Tanacetum cinerariifolium]
MFNIPARLRPELPDGNATIKDSPVGKIVMYTRFIEFANFCLSRTFTETDVYPTFLHSNDEDSLVDHTIKDALKAIAGKKKRKGDESGTASHPTKEFVSSSVTHTSKRSVPEDSRSTQDMNVKSPLPHVDIDVENTKNIVTAFPDRAGTSFTPTSFADRAGTSFTPTCNVRTFAFVPSNESSVDDFCEFQTIDSITAQDFYVPEWNVANDARVDNLALCRNLLDHITPPGYWAV